LLITKTPHFHASLSCALRVTFTQAAAPPKFPPASWRLHYNSPSALETVMRSLALLLVITLWVASFPGCATSPQLLAAASCSHGSLAYVKAVPILKLTGTPYESGYAHGWLTAPGILDMVDAVCASNLLLANSDDYERKILPLVKHFDLESSQEQELQGVLDGIRARLGDRAVFKSKGRPLTYDDLLAYNTCGDWYRQACSSFAAWGSSTQGGHVWVGRNFDFLPNPTFFPYQMVIVRNSPSGHSWATVAVPGMIGCITGINDCGVFAAVNDAFLPVRPAQGQFSPRLFVVRSLMESCEARDLAAQAAPILRAHRQMFDSSILLAAPVSDGTSPSLVFEYDGRQDKTGGVTIRSAGDNPPQLSPEMITCTNHFQKRDDPSFNLLETLMEYRHPLLGLVLKTTVARRQPVDFTAARKTMGAARLPSTVHTVIADLNTLDFWYAPGKFFSPPAKQDFVKLPLNTWLRD